MLGYTVSERTVSRYLPRRPSAPDKVRRWKAFLRNHRDVLAAMDFFVIPTATFRLLYGFFILHHGRRNIVHLNMTLHPTAKWVCQQLREAFPYESAPRYLLLDRDAIFSPLVRSVIRSFGVTPVTISWRSPWQNGAAERWIGSCRRDVLDHAIVLNERHALRLLQEYVGYYNNDRCHLGLGKDTPSSRRRQTRPSEYAAVAALPRIGGLHHRYEWREAA